MLLVVLGIRGFPTPWDAHRGWNEYAVELSAANEPVYFPEMIPPPVSADADLLRALPFSLLSEPDGAQRIEQRLRSPREGVRLDEILVATDESGRASLELIASRLVASGVTSRDTDYLLSADRVLAGLEELEIDFSELARASHHSGAVFSIDYAASTRAPSFPHHEPAGWIADWLGIRAIAYLAVANPEKAWEDVLLLGRLSSALASEPFFESQAVRKKLVVMLDAIVRTGLERRAWSAEQRRTLAALLRSARLMPGYITALRGERARLNWQVDLFFRDGAPTDPELISGWFGGPLDSMRPRDIREMQVAINRSIQSELVQLAGPREPESEDVPPDEELPLLPVASRERLASISELAGEYRAIDAVTVELEQRLLGAVATR